MKSKEKVITVTKNIPDLNKPPHVLPVLLDLLIGNIQNIPIQQEKHLHIHLEACHFCRMALKTLVVIVKGYDQKHDTSDVASEELLERFIKIDAQYEIREEHSLEHLRAYAEVLVERGKREADVRFPEVAVHIKSCSICRSLVASTAASIAKLESSKPN